MNDPQIGMWAVPPEERPKYPDGWLIIRHTPGVAWQDDGTPLSVPALRRLFPISELSNVEAAILRVRQVLQDEEIEMARREREAARRAEAMRRLSYRGVLYASEQVWARPADPDMADGTLSHLSVANVASGSEAQEREMALEAVRARPVQGDAHTELLQRTIRGLRRI